VYVPSYFVSAPVLISSNGDPILNKFTKGVERLVQEGRYGIYILSTSGEGNAFEEQAKAKGQRTRAHASTQYKPSCCKNRSKHFDGFSRVGREWKVLAALCDRTCLFLLLGSKRGGLDSFLQLFQHLGDVENIFRLPSKIKILKHKPYREKSFNFS
jgi:hypothetical protein